jgi:benzoyl-CoA reductase/2-hydroxyglutaryl-CoA dehydratase subunit BcrC/BadD/HgdB
MADYHAMWDELGMNLERHDLLCTALPDAFHDVFLTQENRPEAMDYFNFVVSEIHGVRPAELVEHKKKGGKVFGTFCIYVPDEVIIAAGGIVTGLCGGSQFWVPAGEQVLPANTCPLIKASVGARLDRTCPLFRLADVYIGETTCDGKKKAWEILNQDVPVYVMQLPQMKRPQDLAAWEEEIKLLLARVEQETGNKVTAESLAAAIKLVNDKRRALARLYAARKAAPVPISGKDTLLVSQIAFFDDPARFAAQTNRLAAELEERAAKGQGVFPADAPRVLVSGTPMAIPNWKLHHVIESCGAPVVVEETCTGTRYFEHLVDEVEGGLDAQIHALAERYMKLNCACFTPNQGRVDDIVRLAKEYQAAGVIDCSLQFCNLYTTESHLVQQGLKQAGIPVLHLETDYSEQDAEQLRTRVQAFLELLGK